MKLIQDIFAGAQALILSAYYDHSTAVFHDQFVFLLLLRGAVSSKDKGSVDQFPMSLFLILIGTCDNNFAQPPAITRVYIKTMLKQPPNQVIY